MTHSRGLALPPYPPKGWEPRWGSEITSALQSVIDDLNFGRIFGTGYRFCDSGFEAKTSVGDVVVQIDSVNDVTIDLTVGTRTKKVNPDDSNTAAVLASLIEDLIDSGYLTRTTRV